MCYIDSIEHYKSAYKLLTPKWKSEIAYLDKCVETKSVLTKGRLQEMLLEEMGVMVDEENKWNYLW